MRNSLERREKTKRPARRRRIYHARKNASNNDVDTVSPATPGILTAAQEAYFQDSQARNPDGTLIRVYHGSAVDFDSFDPARLGQGNDSWGNGFYFTTSRETAEGYGGGVKEFYEYCVEYYAPCGHR